ncbi:MAG TPA: (deoxy)nucleoside triphosphate pyrophosphohydrolase [Terriglobia bacterium]|nr:(deoxy)nucleoside triphosphate pyrophosphohydrolase [Terriglobia bacterium]
MSQSKPILVTAGIIVQGEEVLICQRHRSDPYGMQWEFPGGKVKDHEELEACLRRELREELDIEAAVGEEVYRLRHRYPDRYVEVIFFRVDSYRGKVTNRVFESIEWAPRRQLAEYNFLEADQELVERIAEGGII